MHAICHRLRRHAGASSRRSGRGRVALPDAEHEAFLLTGPLVSPIERDILEPQVPDVSTLLILLADTDDSLPVESAPTAKQPKKVVDPDKPKKKRTSGYILYSNAHREEVKEELSGAEGEKPKNTDNNQKNTDRNQKNLTETPKI